MKKSYPRYNFEPDDRHRAPSYLSLAIICTQLLSFPAMLAVKLATEGGKALLRQLNELQKIREPQSVPSLRGTPSTSDICTAYTAQPRSVSALLRIGSRLADLEPSVDRSLIFKQLPNGKRIIVAREPGLKGWLTDHHINVPYSTVMRYKKLATRIRQACGIDGRLPLEWLLPDNQEEPVHLSQDLQAAYVAGKKAVQHFLQKNPTLSALTKAVEKKLGIIRLVTVRKMRKKTRAKKQVFPKKTHVISVKSRYVANGQTVGMDPERLKATMKCLKVLYEPWIGGQSSAQSNSGKQ